jgi:hypothetical protein
MGQVDSARQYLFGDAFRPTMAPKPVKTVRKSRSQTRRLIPLETTRLLEQFRVAAVRHTPG